MRGQRMMGGRWEQTNKKMLWWKATSFLRSPLIVYQIFIRGSHIFREPHFRECYQLKIVNKVKGYVHQAETEILEVWIESTKASTTHMPIVCRPLVNIRLFSIVTTQFYHYYPILQIIKQIQSESHAPKKTWHGAFFSFHCSHCIDYFPKYPWGYYCFISFLRCLNHSAKCDAPGCLILESNYTWGLKEP